MRRGLFVQLVFFLLGSALFCSAGVSYGDTGEIDPAIEGAAQSIFHNVMSPYCKGRLLSDCPSSAATELKDRIRESLLAGKSSAEVYADLYHEFGDDIQAVPESSGFGLFGWLMPALFFLLGVWCLRRYASRRRVCCAGDSCEENLKRGGSDQMPEALDSSSLRAAEREVEEYLEQELDISEFQEKGI